MLKIRLLLVFIWLLFICSGVTGLAIFNIVNLVSHPTINKNLITSDFERGSGRFSM
jgi:hypothetical protein